MVSGRAQNYFPREFKASKEQCERWSRHWMAEGFGAIEAMLANLGETGRFCHGDTPTLADGFWYRGYTTRKRRAWT
jgi:glutathione S-transferase